MIRKSTAADLGRIMEIWLEASIKGQPFLPADYWIAHADTVKNNYIPQSEVFVCEVEHQVLGFVAVVCERHIGALFVDPNHFGEGIGKTLMQYMLKNHKPPITLAAFTKNTKAVAFYKALGFRIKEEEIEAESGQPEYQMEYCD